MALPRLDFHRFCRAHGLEVQEAGRGRGFHVREGWLATHCLFCGGSRGFHLGFHLGRGNLACWRCGGHSAWEFVSTVLGSRRPGVVYQALLEFAAEEQGLRRQVERARLRELEPVEGAGALSRQHRDYLRSRRFSPRSLEAEWDLTGTGRLAWHCEVDWGWRVVSPICDPEGRPVAWVGRAVREGARQRYLVTPDAGCLVDPRSLLYGVHRAREEVGVVVVEGPADVWRLGPGAVATLGSSWRQQQANVLRGFARRYIIYDSTLKDGGGEPDRGAQRRARELASYLGMFPGLTEVVDGFSSDPGDFTDAGARQVMRRLLGGKKK